MTILTVAIRQIRSYKPLLVPPTPKPVIRDHLFDRPARGGAVAAERPPQGDHRAGGDIPRQPEDPAQGDHVPQREGGERCAEVGSSRGQQQVLDGREDRAEVGGGKDVDERHIPAPLAGDHNDRDLLKVIRLPLHCVQAALALRVGFDNPPRHPGIQRKNRAIEAANCALYGGISHDDKLPGLGVTASGRLERQLDQPEHQRILNRIGLQATDRSLGGHGLIQRH